MSIFLVVLTMVEVAALAFMAVAAYHTQALVAEAQVICPHYLLTVEDKMGLIVDLVRLLSRRCHTDRMHLHL